MGLRINKPCKKERNTIAAKRRISLKWTGQSYKIDTAKRIFVYITASRRFLEKPKSMNPGCPAQNCLYATFSVRLHCCQIAYDGYKSHFPCKKYCKNQ